MHDPKQHFRRYYWRQAGSRHVRPDQHRRLFHRAQRQHDGRRRRRAPGATIEGSGTIGGGTYGVKVESTGSASISDVTVTDPATYGIYLAGGSDSVSDAMIDGNTYGIYVTGSGTSATMSGDHVYDNSTAGIEFIAGGAGSIGTTNFAPSAGNDSNSTDLLIDSAAGAVTINDGNAFAATTDYINNQSTENFDLSSYTSTDILRAHDVRQLPGVHGFQRRANRRHGGQSLDVLRHRRQNRRLSRQPKPRLCGN